MKESNPPPPDNAVKPAPPPAPPAVTTYSSDADAPTGKELLEEFMRIRRAVIESAITRPAPRRFKVSHATWYDFLAMTPQLPRYPEMISPLDCRTICGVPIEFDESIERGFFRPVYKEEDEESEDVPG